MAFHRDKEYPVDSICVSTQEEHHEDLIESKERIVLTSLVFRVVKNDTVMKETEDSRENFYDTPNPKDKPDNLFAFPNGKDVLNDSLFHNNHSTIKNAPGIRNTVTDVDNTYGVICDKSDNANPLPLPPKHPPRPSITLYYPLPLPPEHPLRPSITLHHGINNSIEEYKTICNDDCDNNYDVNLDTPQQEVGKYAIKKMDYNDILNVQSETSVSRDNSDNDGMHNNTILK